MLSWLFFATAFADMLPMGLDEPCGQTSLGGQDACPLWCEEGYKMQCVWTGCDWRTCEDFWGYSALRNDRHCKNAGFDYTEKMCCTCTACSNVQKVMIMKDGVEIIVGMDGMSVVAENVPHMENTAWELAYNSEYRMFLIKSPMMDGKVLENVGGELMLMEATGAFTQQWSINLIDGKYLITADWKRLRAKRYSDGSYDLSLIDSQAKPTKKEMFQIVGLDGTPLCVAKEGPLGDAMRWSKPDTQVHPDRPADECLLFDYKFMRNGTYPRRVIKAESPEECWDKCQKDKVADEGVCKGWSYKEGHDEPCRLFSNTKTAMNKTGVISGKRACHPKYGKIAGTGVIPGWKTKGKDGPEIALTDFVHMTYED